MGAACTKGRIHAQSRIRYYSLQEAPPRVLEEREAESPGNEHCHQMNWIAEKDPTQPGYRIINQRERKVVCYGLPQGLAEKYTATLNRTLSHERRKNPVAAHP